ncbi:MAG: hypothetical protein J6386_19440 [Candidatus Synoicihabitans palmerolidicus]|nr:hypothetical protein [Candidatus Synoicihabitans palmerolidicus]
MRRLHIDACGAIEADDFNVFLKRCTALEEFSASGCDQFLSFSFLAQDTAPSSPPEGDDAWHPQFPERRLRKVVLNDCAQLTTLLDLSDYPWLHHLNVNGCAALKHLPALPVGETAEGFATGIRTLFTFQYNSMRDYLGFDVRAVNLSQRVDDNEADGFRAMSW